MEAKLIKVSSESRPRRIRKKKNEIEENEKKLRKCKCGKKYGSYAALYTHIKIKHTEEGVDSEESKKVNKLLYSYKG